jgi:hypothetical protein
VNELSWHECKKSGDCEKLMDKGNKNRMTGATLMNADSSRSHSIFTINVEMCEQADDGEEHFRAGKLNLVDLAGTYLYLYIVTGFIYLSRLILVLGI